MNDAQEIAQPLPANRADAPLPGQDVEGTGATFYLQWFRDINEVHRRLQAGWTLAHDLFKPCHHNEYAVLMRAPEGWEP